MNQRAIPIVLLLLIHTVGFAVTKVACVGDSITAGAGIEKDLRAKHAYPGQLASL